jgi:cytoskeleton protein RodZ
LSQALETDAPPATSGPGKLLADLRAERKLSVADVAQRLKYGVRQIEALEAEEFDRLPGATFVRGMVRGYAKLLETDPDPILGALDQHYVPGEVDLDLRDRGIPFAKSGKHGTKIYLVLLLVVLAILGGVLYEWHWGSLPWSKFTASAPAAQKPVKPQPAPAPAVQREEPKPPVAPAAVQAPPVTAPAAVPAPAQPQAPGGEGRIKMEFAGESWVEIRDADGKLLMSQLNPTGSRRVLSGRSPLSLVIGNAANVRLTYNDKPVDLKPYIQIEVARLTLN